jgi:hypothetical protein
VQGGAGAPTGATGRSSTCRCGIRTAAPPSSNRHVATNRHPSVETRSAGSFERGGRRERAGAEGLKAWGLNWPSDFGLTWFQASATRYTKFPAAIAMNCLPSTALLIGDAARAAAGLEAPQRLSPSSRRTPRCCRREIEAKYHGCHGGGRTGVREQGPHGSHEVPHGLSPLSLGSSALITRGGSADRSDPRGGRDAAAGRAAPLYC